MPAAEDDDCDEDDDAELVEGEITSVAVADETR